MGGLPYNWEKQLAIFWCITPECCFFWAQVTVFTNNIALLTMSQNTTDYYYTHLRLYHNFLAL
jgi:hypothetical protein